MRNVFAISFRFSVINQPRATFTMALCLVRQTADCQCDEMEALDDRCWQIHLAPFFLQRFPFLENASPEIDSGKRIIENIRDGSALHDARVDEKGIR